MERWVEEIESWDGRSFSGGYAGLHDLAADSFSGAVSAGSTWLLFVNGRIVSVGAYRQTAAGDEFEPGEPGVDGDIEQFEDADGTAYEAPHPAVPLLVAMQLTGGETRGSYYTEDTPISEVEETLSDGGFTGYVELSENVLSGDYYTVFQAGRSMDIAFVGNARRLKADDEARELMRDEVGIYEVIAVDLDVTDIPQPPGGSTAGAATGAAAGMGSGVGAGESSDSDDGSFEDAAGIGDDGALESEESDSERLGHGDATADDTTDTPGADSTSGRAEPEPQSVDSGGKAEASEASVGDEGENAEDSEAEAEDSERNVGGHEEDIEASEAEAADGEESVGDVAGESESAAGDDGPSAASVSGDAAAAQRGSDTAPTDRVASRSVPSLDPARTSVADATETTGEHRQDADERQDGPDAAARDRTADDEGTEPNQQTAQPTEPEPAEADERLAELEAELERVRTERNDLIDERDELAAEVDRLRARIAELQEQVDLPGDGPTLSEAEALAGTSLFVRYESKGKTTVEDVHDGDGSSEELEANLRIPAHTQFESENASVAGKPFDQWLHESQRYQFVKWLVSHLVFEIRDTGSAESLRTLYDALPRIDRVEFDAAIGVDGDDSPDEVTFDVVCRDRMGEPLVVASLDASREPVEEVEMAELVQHGVAVCRAEESFAAAFYVTAAFFESPALETAGDATSKSLLSRDARQSYVKESRTRGFHLGLVESRDGAFHLSVPDL